MTTRCRRSPRALIGIPSRAGLRKTRDRHFVRSYRSMSVRELRLVVTASDYDEALRFYRDVLGLPQLAEFESPGGHVVLLDAGRATLELMDDVNAAYVDEVEVGRRVAGHLRIALQVDD